LNHRLRGFKVSEQQLFAAKEKLACLPKSRRRQEIVSSRGFAAPFSPPDPSRAVRGEGMPFELFLKYTARFPSLNLIKIGGWTTKSRFRYEVGFFCFNAII
jgi:hypothetical protein